MTRATQITAAIVAAIEAGATANGYAYNYAGRVFKNSDLQSLASGQFPLPAVVVRTIRDTAQARKPGAIQALREMELEALADSAGDYEATLNDLLHDLRRVIESAGDSWGRGLVLSATTAAAEYDHPTDGSAYASMVLSLGLVYVDNYPEG